MKEVAAMLTAIHAQEDREAAQAKAATVAEKLGGLRLTKAAEGLRSGIDETLAYMAFPSEHWTRLRTNNALERLMREIRRRTRVVGNFPDGQSVLMLVAARLYVATRPGEPAPKCPTRSLPPDAAHRLVVERKAERVEEVVEHPLAALLRQVNPVHNLHDLLELTTLYQECRGQRLLAVRVRRLRRAHNGLAGALGGRAVATARPRLGQFRQPARLRAAHRAEP